MDTSLAEFLNSVDLFRDLGHEHVPRIAGLLSERRLEPGEVAFRMGSDSDGVFLVREGSLEVTVDHHGEKRVLGQVTTGEILGEMGVLEKTGRSATARAVERTRLIWLSEYALAILLGICPVIELRLRLLAARRHSANAALLLESSH